jgi:hypothetical protein
VTTHVELVEDLSVDEVVTILNDAYDRYDYPQLERYVIEMLINLAERDGVRFYRKWSDR